MTRRDGKGGRSKPWSGGKNPKLPYLEDLVRQGSQSVEFYEFTRTMQSYKSIITENTTLVLSTDSDPFNFLKSMTPSGNVEPVQFSGARR